METKKVEEYLFNTDISFVNTIKTIPRKTLHIFTRFSKLIFTPFPFRFNLDCS